MIIPTYIKPTLPPTPVDLPGQTGLLVVRFIKDEWFTRGIVQTMTQAENIKGSDQGAWQAIPVTVPAMTHMQY